MQDIRDRIIEFRRIKASELLDNDGNWRMHPQAQADTLDGILHQIGIADSLLAYYSARAGGALVLIDGHLRKSHDPEQIWPVQITDLTDDEADLLLSVLDPLAAMAKMDAGKFLDLQERVNTDEWAVREALRQLTHDAEDLVKEASSGERQTNKAGPDDMELLPFEHYDYILLMFKNELDWVSAVETFGLERRTDPRKTNKIGLCRVIDGKRVVHMIQALRNPNDEDRHPE